MRRTLTQTTVLLVLLSVGLFALAMGAGAQDDAPAPSGDEQDTVTQDEVNDIASQMYCPVCEMEPLDACMTPACVEWREEIRVQLADGRSEQEIINYFINNYGDKVVGDPQDSTLRALSNIGPAVGAIIAVLAGLWTLFRWQRNKNQAQTASTGDEQVTGSFADDPYRSKLEDDLNY